MFTETGLNVIPEKDHEDFITFVKDFAGIDPATMMLKSNEQFFRTLTSG